MKRRAMVGWIGCGLLAVLPTAAAPRGVDYAEGRQAGLWPQHPVYGGRSFDAFVHSPQNPLHRGASPSLGRAAVFDVVRARAVSWTEFIGVQRVTV
jgi:hypothetical protein